MRLLNLILLKLTISRILELMESITFTLLKFWVNSTLNNTIRPQMTDKCLSIFLFSTLETCTIKDKSVLSIQISYHKEKINRIYTEFKTYDNKGSYYIFRIGPE